MKTFSQYFKFIDEKTKQEIFSLAKSLKDKHIVMINSTPSGGGVSEILFNLVILLNDVGVKTGWRILKGSDSFFQITKEFHNGLQGEKIKLSKRKKDLYEETNKINSLSTHLESHDLVVIHDPQPLALINFKTKKVPWLWRLHIDMSSPDKNLLKYLKPAIEKYDGLIITSDKYRQKSLKIKNHIITPSIDPLAVKNSPLPREVINKVLKRHGVKLNKPIISQISRFDKWKDPLGVLRVFKKIREKFDCQLVLLGNMALDDPEGPAIYKKVQEEANKIRDVKILVNSPDNDRVVNALQSVSKVVFQKSLKEGFALTVSEAMWKGTPVIGTRAGGIPLQIIDGQTGYLIDNDEEAVKATLKLLKNPHLRNKIGQQAKKHVANNFLITRHLLDYLRIFNHYLK